MTLIHWLQAIWFTCVGVTFAEMYLLRRQRNRLREQSSLLAKMLKEVTFPPILSEVKRDDDTRPIN